MDSDTNCVPRSDKNPVECPVDPTYQREGFCNHFCAYRLERNCLWVPCGIKDEPDDVLVASLTGKKIRLTISMATLLKGTSISGIF